MLRIHYKIISDLVRQSTSDTDDKARLVNQLVLAFSHDKGFEPYRFIRDCYVDVPQLAAKYTLDKENDFA